MSAEGFFVQVTIDGQRILIWWSLVIYWRNVECHTYEFINPDANDSNAFIRELVVGEKA